MNSIWYLSACSTCQRIMTELGITEKNFRLQDIKTEPISEEQIHAMHALSGSYEALFSKIARKYRAMGLGEKKLTEADYKALILEEYTFLKRPVIIVEKAGAKHIFIGNAPKTVAAAKALLK